MRSRDSDECRMPSFVGMVALLAIGYALAKNMPDIVRYIKISRM